MFDSQPAFDPPGKIDLKQIGEQNHTEGRAKVNHQIAAGKLLPGNGDQYGACPEDQDRRIESIDRESLQKKTKPVFSRSAVMKPDRPGVDYVKGSKTQEYQAAHIPEDGILNNVFHNAFGKIPDKEQNDYIAAYNAATHKKSRYETVPEACLHENKESNTNQNTEKETKNHPLKNYINHYQVLC